jgi:hypothetical protein
MEFLLSVLSSIIGNLLTPTVKRRMGIKDIHPDPEEPEDINNEDALERRRQRVKKQWNVNVWTAFVFLALLFNVGAALTLPVAIKTNFFSQDLNCTSLRFLQDCGPGGWDVDGVKILLLLLWIGCVAVVWMASQLLIDPIANFVHYNCCSVDEIFYRRILALTIIAIAFILCGHWIFFLFPSVPYWQAVVLPFVIVGVVGSTQRKR